MFKNLNIGARLVVLLVSVLALMAVQIGVAIRSLENAQADLATAYVDNLVPIRVSARVQRLLEEMRTQILLGLQHDPDSALNKLHDHALSQHLETIESALRDAKASLSEMRTDRSPPAVERELLLDFDRAIQSYLTDGIDPAYSALRAGQFHQANVELLLKTNPRSAELTKVATRLREYYAKSSEDMYADAAKRNSRSIAVMIATGVSACLLSLVLALLINRSITRPLRNAVDAARALASGNLAVHIEAQSSDEVGQVMQAMQTMISTLSDTLVSVVGNANALFNAAENVSETARVLMRSSSEQAASTGETAVSIEQMTASIQQTSDNAGVTGSMALKASTEAREGGIAVTDTVEAMKTIVGKVCIIDEIAYRTNLLALNASIEAARSGEHGAGFSVVANEVRKLAEQTQSAAHEIGDLARSSLSLAERVGVAFDEMLPTIDRTSDLVQDIASASREQSAGVSQISIALGQLNKTTQRSASAAETLAATSERMYEQVEQLNQLVGFFRLKDQPRVTRAGIAPAQREGTPAGAV